MRVVCIVLLQRRHWRGVLLLRLFEGFLACPDGKVERIV